MLHSATGVPSAKPGVERCCGTVNHADVRQSNRVKERLADIQAGEVIASKPRASKFCHRELVVHASILQLCFGATCLHLEPVGELPALGDPRVRSEALMCVEVVVPKPGRKAHLQAQVIKQPAMPPIKGCLRLVKRWAIS
jgi:hypothetical protein